MSNPEGQAPEKPSDDHIVLATIVRPHGLKGEVKLSLSCSGIERLQTCKTLKLIRNDQEIKKVTVIRAFMHSDGDAVVRLREVVGVDEAETLRGAQLAVLANEREALPPDSFYLDDLLGLAVETSQGESLGSVVEVMDGLANGILVIRKGEKELLLPTLKSVVKEVDLKGRRMIVEPQEEIDGDNAD